MLSFGHAVYSGLGAYFAVHALNLVAKGQIWLPVTLLPLVGGLAGLVFGVLFGYVTTKRAGTTFAMITLGIGELVFACSLMFPGFFGGEGGITTNRVIGQPFLGITYGPAIQVYYLIAVWALVSHGADVRLDPDAARAHGQRGARQSRARRVRRLRPADGALAHADHLGLLRRHRRRAAAASTTRSSPPRTWARCAPAACCSPPSSAASASSSARSSAPSCSSASWSRCRHHDQGLAALPRPVLHADGDVRAGRHRQPDPHAAAGDRAPSRFGAHRCRTTPPTRRRRRCWCSPALVLMVEMTYTISVDSANGTVMKLFGSRVRRRGRRCPGRVAIGLLVVGGVAVRADAPAASADAWGEIQAAIAAGGGAHERRAANARSNSRRAQELRQHRDHPRRRPRRSRAASATPSSARTAPASPRCST